MGNKSKYTCIYLLTRGLLTDKTVIVFTKELQHLRKSSIILSTPIQAYNTDSF